MRTGVSVASGRGSLFARGNLTSEVDLSMYCTHDVTDLHIPISDTDRFDGILQPTMTSWEEASAVQKLDTKTYSCTLHDDWCIGTGRPLCAIELAEIH